MSLDAIKHKAFEYYTNASDIAIRAKNLYDTNDTAAMHGTVAMIVTGYFAGNAALAGALISTFAHRSFSILTTLKCTTFGVAIGAIFSSYSIYKFVSEFRQAQQAE